MENTKIIQAMLQAGRLEAESPQKALKAYRQVKKLNEAVYPGMIIIATLLPAVATVISYFISTWFGSDSCFIWILSILIQLFIGFYPVFMLRDIVLDETLFMYETKVKDKPRRSSLLGVFMVMANDWMAFLGIIMFGLILGGPEIWLLSVLLDLPLDLFDYWPRPLYYFSYGFILLVGCSFYLTNMPLSPYIHDRDYGTMQERFAKLRWRFLSTKTLLMQVPAGWYFNRGLISQTIANFIYYFYAARIAFNVAETPLLESVISGLFAGILFGQNFWKIQNDPVIEFLADLGQVRCLFRKRKWYAAREYIFSYFEHSLIKPLLVENRVMHHLFWVLQPGWPDEYKKKRYNYAVQDLELCRTQEEWKYPYASLWKDSLDRTEMLIKASPIAGAEG